MFGTRWVYASCDVSMAKGVTCAVYGARLRPVNVTKGSAVGKFSGMAALPSFSGHTEGIPWLFAVRALTEQT